MFEALKILINVIGTVNQVKMRMANSEPEFRIGI